MSKTLADIVSVNISVPPSSLPTPWLNPPYSGPPPWILRSSVDIAMLDEAMRRRNRYYYGLIAREKAWKRRGITPPSKGLPLAGPSFNFGRPLK